MIADALQSPHPIGATLPAIFADDHLLLRLCAALDSVLAPDILLLDCFPAYLDPSTAPPDLLDWLAGWVGLGPVGSIPLERRRTLVARAAQLHARRGTPAAVRELAEVVTGHPVEIRESGGAIWSSSADTAPPGSDSPALEVRIRLDDDPLEEHELELLRRLLALVVPAHVAWNVETQR